MTTFHIYCDESCHGENDGHGAMVVGSLLCPRDRAREVAVALRGLKAKHGLSPTFELKWTKVSKGKAAYYCDVIDYFLKEDDLRFRALVVPDKAKLRHNDFGQTHDDFYYKVYFQLVKHWLERSHAYRIFLDIKDTRSAQKTEKLRDVLAHSQYDFDQKIVQRIDLVRSEQVEALQLADLLIGAVSYANRGLSGNAGKLAVIRRLRERTGLVLTKTTLLAERKVNIFCWRAQELGQ
jgi:hypothetical protein